MRDLIPRLKAARRPGHRRVPAQQDRAVGDADDRVIIVVRRPGASRAARPPRATRDPRSGAASRPSSTAVRRGRRRAPSAVRAPASTASTAPIEVARGDRCEAAAHGAAATCGGRIARRGAPHPRGGARAGAARGPRRRVAPGVVVEQRVVPLGRVGCYVPGGRYPAAVVAADDGHPRARRRRAGGHRRSARGRRRSCWRRRSRPASRACSAMGGAHAIAALAYGTGTVPRVDKIVGPGNRVRGGGEGAGGAPTARIDFYAGPTEIVVVSRDGARPTGSPRPASRRPSTTPTRARILITTSRRLAEAVRARWSRTRCPTTGPRRAALAAQRRASSSRGHRPRRVALANRIAPEHLRDRRRATWSRGVPGAGAIFVGPWTRAGGGRLRDRIEPRAADRRRRAVPRRAERRRLRPRGGRAAADPRAGSRRHRAARRSTLAARRRTRPRTRGRSRRGCHEHRVPVRAAARRRRRAAAAPEREHGRLLAARCSRRSRASRAQDVAVYPGLRRGRRAARAALPRRRPATGAADQRPRRGHPARSALGAASPRRRARRRSSSSSRPSRCTAPSRRAGRRPRRRGAAAPDLSLRRWTRVLAADHAGHAPRLPEQARTTRPGSWFRATTIRRRRRGGAARRAGVRGRGVRRLRRRHRSSPASRRMPNVVVGRTFAKAYGLAGLRVGCLVAQPATSSSRCAASSPPYSVNVFAAAALGAALGDRGLPRAVPATRSRQSRRLLYDACAAPRPAVLAERGELRAGARRRRAARVRAALAERGVLVRDRSRRPAARAASASRPGCVEHTRACVGGAGGGPVRRAVIDRQHARDARSRSASGSTGAAATTSSTGIRFLDHMLELVARHGGFDLPIDGRRRPRRRSAPHRRGRRHRARRGRVAGARHAARHQPRRLLRDADGRDAGGGGHRPRRPAARRRRPGRARAARSATCRPSWCTTSSRASRCGARANVHVKVLYGRSSHHQVEAVFKAFARALRVACAKDRRLARDAAEHEGAAVIALVDYGAGNLTSVRKALAARRRRGLSTPATPAELGRRTRPSSCRASVTSARPRRSTPRWRDAIRAALDARRAAARHLPRPAVAVRGQRRGARRAAGLGLLPGPAVDATCRIRESPDGDRLQGARTSAGTRSRSPARVAAVLAGVAPTARRSTSRTPTPRPSRTTRWPLTAHGEHVRGGGRARAACSACSSTRRSRATSGSRMLAQLRRGAGHDRTTARAPVHARSPDASSPASTSATARSSRACNFEGLRDAGDPAELARRYNVEGIDELVILDVTATLEDAPGAGAHRSRAVARELFIPLAVGGGIRTRGRRRGGASRPAPTR